MVTKLLRICFIMILLTACSHIQKPSLLPAPAKVSPTVPHQIALLLPQTGGLVNAGKAVQAGFMDAYQHNSIKPIIKVYDESQYDQAVKDGANYIVGPLSKDKVIQLEQRKDIKTMTIALNNPDTSIFNANLYEFALSPIDEANQMADQATVGGHHAALLIYPQGPWGQNIANALQKRWQKNGGQIIASLPVANLNAIPAQIKQLLNTQGYDVIFMIVQPQWAREIKPLLKFYGHETTPVYSTSLVYSGLMNSAKDSDLDGVIFCDMPLVLDKAGQWASVRQNITLSQPITIQQYIRLYGLGFDAGLLTQNFTQLSQGTSGATGHLYMNKQNDILRKLPMAIFKNGIPESLT